MIFLQLSRVFRISKNITTCDRIFERVAAIGITVIIGVPKEINTLNILRIKGSKRLKKLKQSKRDNFVILLRCKVYQL